MEIIPTNSESLNVEDSTIRFQGAQWFSKIKQLPVVIVGLGGIGSHTAFLISRVSPQRLFLIDNDTIEAVNMAGQLYGENEIGLSKAFALTYKLRNLSPTVSVGYSRERLTTSSELSCGILICGFDNMEARRVAFNKWCRYVTQCANPKECLFIDGRLAAEEFQIIAIKGDDKENMKRYMNEFLFSDYEAEETHCSYKQTTYAASMIASFITNIYINFVTNLTINKPDPTAEVMETVMDRPVPFLTYFNASLMLFKYEL